VPHDRGQFEPKTVIASSTASAAHRLLAVSSEAGLAPSAVFQKLSAPKYAEKINGRLRFRSLIGVNL
jgi:hypothetical protein